MAFILLLVRLALILLVVWLGIMITLSVKQWLYEFNKRKSEDKKSRKRSKKS